MPSMKTRTYRETLRPTRYAELFYRQDAPTLWRIYVKEAGDIAYAVGPHYRTKAELLADLQQYAELYGI